MDKRQKIIIQGYLDSSILEIEESIGRIVLINSDLYEAGAEHEDVFQICNEFVQSKLHYFRQKICSDWNYKEKIKDAQYMDNVTLIATIADVIASCSDIVPSAMIATLLVKKGLNKLCTGDLNVNNI